MRYPGTLPLHPFRRFDTIDFIRLAGIYKRKELRSCNMEEDQRRYQCA